MPQQCPFCHFINNKPNDLWVVGETENFYAWLEYPEPRAKGQTNIVPKDHKESLLELTEKEWQEAMGLLRETMHKVMEGLEADGVSVTMNVKEAGGQMVPHAYIQIFPRFTDDENAGTPTGAIFPKNQELQNEEMFQEVQDSIKNAEVGGGKPPKQRPKIAKRSASIPDDEEEVEEQKGEEEEDEEEKEDERNKSAAEQWKGMKRGGY
ncbi:MAG: HIT family protein [Candidatus Aenigmatarchaeota archaeon]